MPVLDWTRTQMDAPLPGGARALRFNLHEYVAFDWLMLQRPGAEDGIAPEVLESARQWHDRASESDKARLLANIMAGLPGAYDRYDIPGLRRMLDRYQGIGPPSCARISAASWKPLCPRPRSSACVSASTRMIRRARSSACRAWSRLKPISRRSSEWWIPPQMVSPVFGLAGRKCSE